MGGRLARSSDRRVTRLVGGGCGLSRTAVRLRRRNDEGSPLSCGREYPTVPDVWIPGTAGSSVQARQRPRSAGRQRREHPLVPRRGGSTQPATALPSGSRTTPSWPLALHLETGARSSRTRISPRRIGERLDCGGAVVHRHAHRRASARLDRLQVRSSRGACRLGATDSKRFAPHVSPPAEAAAPRWRISWVCRSAPSSRTAGSALASTPPMGTRSRVPKGTPS